MLGNVSVSDSKQALEGALKLLEQYGPSTTSTLATTLSMPLLALRSQLKSAASLGLIEESNCHWRLKEQLTGSSVVTDRLQRLIRKHSGKKLRHIVRFERLDYGFLKSWLDQDGSQYFSSDRFGRVYANNDEVAGNFQSSVRDPQQEFITAPLDVDLTVMAPPGTGKTYALVKRIAWMSAHLPQPRDMASVCVLSFTNNAVDEITSRLGRLVGKDDVGDSVRYVKVRTFDSFAMRCLIDAGLTVTSDFDENIKRFTVLLRSDFVDVEIRPNILFSIRWLFVDEVQDLSGLRGDMVFELAEFLKRRTDARFAFLGDRHQGIYNDDHGPSQPVEFLKLQPEILMGRSQCSVTFRDSYRYTDPSFAVFMERARTLLDCDESPKNQALSLVSAISQLNSDEVDEWLVHSGGIAILAGQNKTVAKISSVLLARGISHKVIEGSANHNGWPIWIWQVFHSWRQPEMSRSMFMRKSKAFGDPDVLYSALIKRGLANDTVVSVRRISDHVLNRHWREDQTLVSAYQGITLSTIHKAKGLQYDKVLMVTDDSGFAKEDQARLLYVAMTRARQEVRCCTSTTLIDAEQFTYGKGLEHYRINSMLAQAKNDRCGFECALSLLKELVGTTEPLFKIEVEDGDKPKLWLCAQKAKGMPWIRVVKWSRVKDAFVPENRTLKPSRWATVAWPDDAACYKKILGPQLLLPLPVFTHGM